VRQEHDTEGGAYGFRILFLHPRHLDAETTKLLMDGLAHRSEPSWNEPVTVREDRFDVGPADPFSGGGLRPGIGGGGKVYETDEA
jgi:hypothetical protein